MRFCHVPNPKPFSAGVIGGGITGLATAWRLSRLPQCSRITLYEKSPRLGGYIQSETIPVDGGNVVFEYGARSIRLSRSFEYILAEMLDELGIGINMLTKSQFTNTDLDSYIYYPDRLIRVPTSKRKDPHTLLSLAQEPVFRGALLSALCEPFRSRPSVYPHDESVGQFISRRFSKRVADDLVSALFHGIYAGDINKLSAEALVGKMREREASDGSIGRSLLRSYREHSMLAEVAPLMAASLASHNVTSESDLVAQRAEAITWKNGLVELIDALTAALKTSKKVNIITNADVNAISKVQSSSDLTVSYGRGKSAVHNRVIATNPAPDVVRMLSNSRGTPPENSIASLSSLNYAVTVMVVNLYYSQPNLVPARGFGYLIPQSIPPEQNPEGALGVIFSSETSVQQDTAPGTKLTVMLGGHLWDHMKESGYPDHDQGVAMARSLLERHLGIKEAPTLARSRLQRNGIPQYTVGHKERLRAISRYVQDDFDHRLTLAGNWYGGVSIPNCIEQAYLAASFGVGSSLIMNDEDVPLHEAEGGICLFPKKWRKMSRDVSRR